MIAAGVGKSVLASIVVDYLRNIFKPTYSYSVAAAYCNFKEREIQSPENLLAGLCVQVIDDSKPLPETLVQLHGCHASRRTRPSLDDVLDVFKEAAKRFETTYLIVDALDECLLEVRRVLLQELKSLQPMVRLLVTTRPPTDQFAEDVTIEISASDDDLEKYVQSRVAGSSRLSKLLHGRTELLRYLCNKVIEKASGMFLAATLHMDSLATKMSVKTLKQAIGDLPSTLNQLYDEAFRRIDDQNADDRDFANKALRWVAYAYRPLTVLELKEALAIEPRGQDFDADAAPDIALVLEACAGLLIVDKETEQVRLVHYTAQDYLDPLLTSRYREAHASIAEDCITYLNYDVFQFRQCDNDHERRFEAHMSSLQLRTYLLAYALVYWAKHCRMAGQGVELGAQLYNFLASNPRIRLFASGDDVKWFEFPLSSADLEKINGIGIAACYGLCDALRRLLQQNEVDINGTTDDGHSALHLAALNDEIISVQLLLEHGADIECNAKDDGTPLLVAINSNSVKTARLLMERGADTRNEVFARVRGASPIPFLQLLLDHGADVNTRDDHGTQLMWRARNDDVETARWLLGKGAAIDLRDSYPGRTALLAAATRGSVDMVDLLLGHSADFSIGDTNGDTILHAACKVGKVALVKRFLDLGIGIDATDSRGITPIQFAIRHGHTECFELLLASYADADKSEQFGDTPLMDAISSGSTKIIHRLLDAGVKVDLQGRKGCTALHYAVSQSDTTTVRLLLKHHANCSERSSLDLSLKHDGSDPFRGGSFNQFVWDKKTTFLDARALYNGEWSLSLSFSFNNMLKQRSKVHECQVWKGGMTALDIAYVLNDAACIDLLEPLTGSRTESTTVPFGDFLCEVFGFVSIAELEKEFERREKEEFAQWL
ncbi:MAG: hypothetical protein Q9184_006986 [Pyrenodesmia sp. 2 TL-2023]